jgi:hypothetical protein
MEIFESGKQELRKAESSRIRQKNRSAPFRSSQSGQVEPMPKSLSCVPTFLIKISFKAEAALP